MDNNHLAAYLSNHLAESGEAVGLLYRAETMHQDTKMEQRVLEPILKRIARRGVCGKIRLYRTFLLTRCSRLV
jgi:hypothetical protein